MKQRIEVKDQVRLGLAKVCELCIGGIKYRLFRSLVTVATVALAVTFLMTMLSQSIIRRNVSQAVAIEVAPQQWYDGWLNRLTRPMTHEELQSLLRNEDRRGYQDRLAEIQGWGELTDGQLQEMVRVARQEHQYLNYINSRRDEIRALLLGPQIDEGWAILEALDDPDRMQDFQTYWSKLPTDEEFIDGFSPFVDAWNRQQPLRAAVLQGQRESVEALDELLGDRRAEQMLAEGGPEALQTLRQAGYVVNEESLAALVEPAQLALTLDDIFMLRTLRSVRVHLARKADVSSEKVNDRILFEQARSLGNAEEMLRVLQREQRTARQNLLGGLALRRITQQELPEPAEMARLASAEGEQGEWIGHLAYIDELVEPLARQAGVDSQDLDPQHLTELASTASGAQEILDVVREHSVSLETAWRKESMSLPTYRDRLALLQNLLSQLDPESMVAAAQARLRADTLRQVEARLAGEDTSGPFGFGQRTLWLIGVSFLVCAVGIANAMLMSVTERFREIATMKCLGALDGFIMSLFVLESCIQGVAGGLAGAVVGLLLGVAQSYAEFRGLAFGQFPLGGILACMGVSMLAGIFLAALAAVYPSWVASRMAPMEAMRVE